MNSNVNNVSPVQNNQQNDGITLGDILRVLRKNWILIAIITAVIFVAGVVYTFGIVKPTYKATATVKVEVPLTTENSADVSNSLNASLRYVQSVADAVKLPTIAKKVVEANPDINISAENLINETSTSYSSNTVFVKITVTDRNGENAKILANSLATEISKYSKDSTDESVKAEEKFICSIVVLDQADGFTYAAPNKKLYLIVAFLGGLVISLVVVFIKEFASTKFQTPEDVKALGLPVLNTLIDDKSKDNKDSDSLIEPSVKNFEPYNRLISNIKFSNVDNPYRVVMFTSSIMNELKTTVCSNYAFTLAHNEKKVIIVDLDTRKPRIHKTFGVEKEKGIVEYLAGNITKDELIKSTKEGVDIITVGKDVSNPVTLLESQKLADLIKELKEEYDFIAIDTPPLTACNDAAIISKLVDGVVFNVAINQGKKKEIKSSLEQLKDANANVIGINITKANIKDRGGYYYYYYYEYGDKK
ncbi:MAG: polysaccharide biosynthesis tyrosine autokinase [Acholeplasmatales bacterium]|nr:polysaccharide biosynthesis tyrosine autokinase [Acholeplasmatales bacterium]